MKFIQYVFSLCLVIVFLTACAGSRQGRALKNHIDGSWNLQTINTEGIDGKVAIKVFNEADLDCFLGSSWDFISNNSSGNYTLVGGSKGCSTLQRNIRWSLIEGQPDVKEFQFKRLSEKNVPMDDNNGFRLSITKLEDKTMQLKSAITFDGKPGNIVYNFVKKQ